MVKQIGVIIEDGIEDWKIVQQINGYGEINLFGRYLGTAGIEEGKVYARLVREDTGDTVIPWTECQHGESSKWGIKLERIPAGGLYRIETCLNFADNAPWSKDKWSIEWGLRGDIIHHVGVGDIYVIAGQSNAAGVGKDPVYDPPEIGIHILKNSGKWGLASHPLNDSTDIIHTVNRETSNPGHSPFLSFARTLKRQLGYPIGLLQTSLGGSPLSRWNPEEIGDLYENMVSIIKSQGGTVSGILWYQGCSDTVEGLCDTYKDRFTGVVERLRKDLGNTILPFLTVQLNRSVEPLKSYEDGFVYWGKIREAQRQCAREIDNVFIVSSTDSSLSDLIHNSSASNIVLGERLAKSALAEIYRKNYIYRAPDLSKAVRITEDQVLLIFENVIERLYFFDVAAEELPFTIEDEVGQLVVIDYHINKEEVTLKLDRKLQGKSSIHGAYEKNPKKCVPIDIEGHLPMLSFYGVEIFER